MKCVMKDVTKKAATLLLLFLLVPFLPSWKKSVRGFSSKLKNPSSVFRNRISGRGGWWYKNDDGVYGLMKMVDDDDDDRKMIGLDEKQLDFTMGYMNKHHREFVTLLATVFSPLGAKQKRKNAFRGGSYKIADSRIVNIEYGSEGWKIELESVAKILNEADVSERVSVLLDSDPIPQMKRSYETCPMIPSSIATSTRRLNPMDDFVRRMNRLCHIVHEPSVTGKLIQLALQLGGDNVGLLKENMYLNQVPHNRYVRRYFYDLASDAVLDAVIQCSEKKISNRMKVVAMFPELNPTMDSYRIGTLLELVRSISIKLAEENLHVRVCVQASMGIGIFAGVPKSLNGVATLLQRMDWQSEEGEENEGMVGRYVNFGAVGAEHVMNARIDRKTGDVTREQDDVFIIVCPQSMVGIETSIMGPLKEMVDAAGDRPVILINPDLSDKRSAQGQQGVRGRGERLEFANSFNDVFHFRNIYVSGTSYFPILGAVTKLKVGEPWVAHQRRDRAGVEGGEVYVPMLSTETDPDGEVIMSTFEM